MGLSLPFFQMNPNEQPGSFLQKEAITHCILIFAFFFSLQSSVILWQVSKDFMQVANSGCEEKTALSKSVSKAPNWPLPGIKKTAVVLCFPRSATKGLFGATNFPVNADCASLNESASSSSASRMIAIPFIVSTSESRRTISGIPSLPLAPSRFFFGKVTSQFVILRCSSRAQKNPPS